jgi:polysaccharide pyruvyl transferase WcaK-like protein
MPAAWSNAEFHAARELVANRSQVLMSLPTPSHSLEQLDRQDQQGRKHGLNQPKISLFGHFGAANFGNESTFQAMLWNLRSLMPDAEITCVCTAPETVAVDYNVATVPISGVFVKAWTIRNPLSTLARKLFVGIPSELYRWFKGIMVLRRMEVLIIPGTGLLNDAFSLAGWGPYSTFKWSVIAKLCRCRLFFVSIGGGPLQSTAGRFLAKFALSLADFRSYRDRSTLQYLKQIGFRSGEDQVFPDLAFSLPPALLPDAHASKKGCRPVVGLGLMVCGGMYGADRPTSAEYSAYLETLVGFVKWVLGRENDVRLLIGDLADVPVIQEFKSLLRARSVTYEEERIIAEPITSAGELLSQLASTDLVVGTRFHNVLLALLLNKPSIAISFHHKCSSLMSEMGLSEYCQDIKQFNSDKLIEQFCNLEKNAAALKQTISEKVSDHRKALDEQYGLIFESLLPPKHHRSNCSL